MTKEEIQHLLDHSNPQSEEALEFSSMLQFHGLGWQCEYSMNEDESNSFLGRKDFTEVVLDKYLLPKLKDLNSGKPDRAIKKALDILKEDRSVMQTVNANKEILHFLHFIGHPKRGKLPNNKGEVNGNKKTTTIHQGL